MFWLGLAHASMLLVLLTAAASSSAAIDYGQILHDPSFDEYEAEDGNTNGTILTWDKHNNDDMWNRMAAESSNRQAVLLQDIGDFVEIRARNAANSIVVRYAIPDASNGGGIETPTSLSVTLISHDDDGVVVVSQEQRLPLTSRYAWVYGGSDQTLNDPQHGGALKFFDEVADFLKPFPANSTIRLVKTTDSMEVAFIVIDLIDLEMVEPPLERPSNSLSIVDDCGAVPDDDLDDGPAIQACIDAARETNRIVWLPVGRYHRLANELYVSNALVQGAGMWYSILAGEHARFHFVGGNNQFYDFSLVGEVVERNDSHVNHGFHGLPGSGTILERLWVERTLTGLIVGSTPEIPTDGLIVRQCRFRTLFADGVNVNGGSSNVLIENNHFRYTGDDAIASWSSNHGTPSGANTNNTFRNNIVQLPWRANCIAVYGGADNRVENNLCLDTLVYPGIFLASQFDSDPFSGTTVIRNNQLFRAGGSMWGKEYGAIVLLADEADIAGFLLEDIIIDEPTFSGIQIDSYGNPFGVSDVRFERIIINSPGTWGIDIREGVNGQAEFVNVTIRDPVQGSINAVPSSTFEIIKTDEN